MKQPTSIVSSIPDRAAAAAREFNSALVDFRFPSITQAERAEVEKFNDAFLKNPERTHVHPVDDACHKIMWQAAEFMLPILVRESEAVKAGVAHLKEIELQQFGLVASGAILRKLDQLAQEMDSAYESVRKIAHRDSIHPRQPIQFIAIFSVDRDASFFFPASPA